MTDREAHDTPPKPRSGATGRTNTMRLLSREPLVLVSLTFLALLVVFAVAAEVVAPYDPNAQDLLMRNKPPLTPGADPGAAPHVLGTDPLGRDLLSRIIYGARVSILVAALTVLLSGIFGIVVGVLAGYFGGRFDDIVMRFVDLQMSLPFLLIALLVLFVLGPGFWNVILVLAVVKWMIYARVSRSLVLSQKSATHVDAARVVGATNLQIMTRHIFPSMTAPLLVLATLECATIIIGEAALSFLGFGIQPPTPSWGSMLGEGRSYIATAWWIVAIPGLMIFLTALSLNLTANWARLVTDPKGRTELVTRRRRALGRKRTSSKSSETSARNTAGDPNGDPRDS